MIIECTDELCQWPALRGQTPVADALQHAAETGHPVKIEDGPITAYACGAITSIAMESLKEWSIAMESLKECLKDAEAAIEGATIAVCVE